MPVEDLGGFQEPLGTRDNNINTIVCMTVVFFFLLLLCEKPFGSSPSEKINI